MVLFSSTKQSSIYTGIVSMDTHCPTFNLYKIIPYNRRQNCFLLYAISLRGTIVYEIIVGTFNDTFCTPFIVYILLYKLERNEKAIIMDDMKFHHSKVVLSAVTSNGIFVTLQSNTKHNRRGALKGKSSVD